ncbi:hypothetical protein LTR36_005536 [Oleoguttula mirabilis]|uniref:Vacuolar ATPase assembly protein VMA22 n=1 Tax=Oleoguttula mirabilis TaxID=1507867 RepID=A0AAV9JED5_9PEZI|nr:hypothetical protein LTR36_005536 [Oleoguttula mirabilis]
MATISSLTPLPKPEDAGEVMAELTTLHDQLDSLWERYLAHLDEYQEAQKQIQKQLSSGFFSLAQANFKSRDRGRYGQDYYDGRTKASRRCGIRHNDDASATLGVEIVTVVVDEQGSTTKGTKGENDEKTEPRQQPSPPSTPAPDDHAQRPVKSDAPTANKQNEPAPPPQVSSGPPRDPLHWFGILVPRELRSAQSSFSCALAGPLLDAVNAGRALRGVEAEIRRVRKAVRRMEKAAGS